MIAHDLNKLAPEATIEFEAHGTKVAVRYDERQAHGDDGKPVPGDTVGEFTITWPNGHTEEVHVGPGPLAKPYHAERIAEKITRTFFRAKQAT